jgi:hypothetical protein
VLNQNTSNAWGNPRGYIIHPGPLCHLTNLNSSRTARNAEWAKSHLSVTRRKDNEGKASSMFNGNLPGRPAVDFGKVRRGLCPGRCIGCVCGKVRDFVGDGRGAREAATPWELYQGGTVRNSKGEGSSILWEETTIGLVRSSGYDCKVQLLGGC